MKTKTFIIGLFLAMCLAISLPAIHEIAQTQTLQGGTLGPAPEGPPPAFVPTDIAGCQLWLEADSLSLSNNDPVTSWTDLSGQSHHATEATNPPTYKTGILNSLPVVRFDGSDDKLSITDWGAINDANFTVFIVAKPNSITQFAPVFIKTNMASYGSGFGLIKYDTTANAYRWFMNTWDTSHYSVDFTWTENNWKINCFRWDSADPKNIEVLLNTSSQGTDSNVSNFPGTDADFPVVMGVGYGGAAMAEDVYAVILYNSLLSEINMGKVHTYLNGKVAIY